MTDYGANYQFVQHVLSMDTTFKAPAVMYRAIATPWMWNAGYWLIIAGEGADLPALRAGRLAHVPRPRRRRR